MFEQKHRDGNLTHDLPPPTWHALGAIRNVASCRCSIPMGPWQDLVTLHNHNEIVTNCLNIN